MDSDIYQETGSTVAAIFVTIDKGFERIPESTNGTCRDYRGRCGILRLITSYNNLVQFQISKQGTLSTNSWPQGFHVHLWTYCV
jgi:hypothetical protein